MRTVTYQSLLDRLAGYIGEADGLSVEDAAVANAKINFFARLGWEHFFHPDITPIEKRYFRAAYSSSEDITAGTERYFIAANAYYVALRDQSPATQAPATLSGGEYETNEAYWADADPDPTGEDWATGTVFVLGDKTRRLDDGLIYQCHTAHTAGASFDATKFGGLQPFIRSLSYDGTFSNPAPSTPTMMSGTLPLGNGVSSGSVTGLALSAAPTVIQAWIMRPAGGLNLDVWPIPATFTTDGFSFELDGLTDSADYVLAYAFLVGASSGGGVTPGSTVTNGTLALGSGVSSGSVTSLNLGTTPTLVRAWIQRPAGSLNLNAWTISGTVTPDGFDFELDGLTDSADYVLCYEIWTPTSVAEADDTETPIGDVKAIWDRNPETNRHAQKVKFRLRTDLIQVLGCVNVVWVEFRRRVPTWSGSVRSDSATYAADVTVFDAATGDFWTSTTTIGAGQTPTTNPERWDKVEFPYYLAEFVAQSAYAMMTNREQSIPENFNIQMAAGFPLLLAEITKLERQQGQTRQLNVVSSRY